MSWANRPCVPRFKKGSEAEKHLTGGSSSTAREAKPAHLRREGQSEKHLALIRRLPCCLTLRTVEIQAHHLKMYNGERGAGLRSTDRNAVPMWVTLHLYGVEKVASNLEHDWFKQNGLADPYKLAADLWQRTGNLEHMQAVVYAHVMHFGTHPLVQEIAAVNLYRLQHGEVVETYDAAKRAGA